MKRQLGLTLVELMVVVAVMAILAAIAYPLYTNQVQKSRRMAGGEAWGHTPIIGRGTTHVRRLVGLVPIEQDGSAHFKVPALRSISFNLLDARHAISVTERQRFILRVRTLARAVAQAYYDAREALGFPMVSAAREVANG